MNPFDMAIVVIVGLMTILGIFRGLVREAASIAGLLAGFYIAYVFYQPVGDLLGKYAVQGAYAHIAGFVILFSLTFAGITLAGALIRYLMNLALLGVLDRMLGALFGAVKGMLLVSFGYLLLVTFVPGGGGQMISGSKLGPPVYALSRTIIQVVPASTRNRLYEQLQNMSRAAEPEKAGGKRTQSNGH